MSIMSNFKFLVDQDLNLDYKRPRRGHVLQCLHVSFIPKNTGGDCIHFVHKVPHFLFYAFLYFMNLKPELRFCILIYCFIFVILGRC